MPKVPKRQVPYPPTHVIWQDATSRSSWQDTREVPGLATVFTLGYMTQEDRTSLTICNSIDTDNGNAGDCITIPKAWILKRKRIRT